MMRFGIVLHVVSSSGSKDGLLHVCNGRRQLDPQIDCIVDGGIHKRSICIKMDGLSWKSDAYIWAMGGEAGACRLDLLVRH